MGQNIGPMDFLELERRGSVPQGVVKMVAGLGTHLHLNFTRMFT